MRIRSGFAEVLEVQRDDSAFELPESLDVDASGGLALDFWVRLDDLAPGQVLVDSRTAEAGGLAVVTAENGTLRIELDDGRAKAAWDCDPGLLQPGKLHHVAAIVDAGPGIISFLVDGRFCDGGDARDYGWGRYADALADVRGSGKLRLAPSLHGELKRLRIYRRYLRTSEAVANFHAGP